MRMQRATTALFIAALSALTSAARASSHREAPFVTKNPKVDGTDLYVFNSFEPNRTGFVTLIANYQPLQDAYGGPNYFELDPDALYEISIDNTGDGVEDLTFQFQFQNTLAPSADGGAPGLSLPIGYADGGSTQTVAIPLVNIGNVETPGNLNVIETYTVNVVTGPRRSGASTAVKNAATQATVFTKPTDNIGLKSFPNAGGYAAYAAQYIYSITLPNCATPGRMFVGQRAEPFAVNLGPIFDLIDIPKQVVTGAAGPSVYPNPLAKKNITSLELEVPASCITQSATQPVIGVVTTASVRQARVINPSATYSVPSVEGGAWTEVSRLGAPLVNEVVIGLPDKDRWNSSAPANDAQFAKYVTNPTLPAIIDVLFGPGLAPQLFPRTDLVEAFLTGVPGVNAFPTPDAGPAPAAVEELRLNTALPATPAAQQNYLGATGCFNKGVLDTAASTCDPAGFPNGRRPGDDVVDIALDVMMGALIGNPAIAPAYNVQFTDGVQQTAAQFATAFPYLNPPTQGANGDGT